MVVMRYEGSLKKSEDCRFPEQNGLDVSINGDKLGILSDITPREELSMMGLEAIYV